MITFQNQGHDKPAVGLPHALFATDLQMQLSLSCGGPIRVVLAAVLASEAPYVIHRAGARVPNRRHSISFRTGIYCIIGSNVNPPSTFARPDM